METSNNAFCQISRWLLPSGNESTNGEKYRIVRNAAAYAPTAMNPAWPRENCPACPLMMFSETARMMLIPINTMMWL